MSRSKPSSLGAAYEREALMNGFRFKPEYPENKDFALEFGEPPPIKNDKPEAWSLVMKDMEARNDFGKKKYKTALQPFNGRNALKDAYEEALDLCVYLRQAIYEQGDK